MRVVVLCVGVALIVLAGWLGLSTRAALAAAERVPGRVSGLNAGGSHPEIAFTTRAGVAIHYPQGGMIFGYRAGDAVEVLYRPDDPRGTAVIADFGALWGDALVALGAGVLVLGAGLVVVFGSGRSSVVISGRS